jgi:miniconductance mechanosensitive channel
MNFDIFFREHFLHIYNTLGFSDRYVNIATEITAIIILLAIAAVAFYLTKFVLKQIFIRVIKRTKSKYDDVLIDSKFLRRLSYIVPLIIVYKLVILALPNYPGWALIIMDITNILLILYVLLAIYALLDSFHNTYQKTEAAKSKPIKGYLQILKILGGFVGGILVIAIVINESPGYLLGGLGAMTAVLLLVFKDTILGFVASVQLSSNDILRPGDWITMDKYKADGDVLEISLNSVKVKNFDNTIVSIPTYALISDSFQNWRGMQESDGRRLKRSVNIDLDSVRFMEEDEIEKLKAIKILREYLEKTQKELDEYNKSIAEGAKHIVNKRKQTNLGIFRAYLTEYLKNHKDIQPKLTLMVRQLPPGDNGVALELYCFTKTKAWVEYEAIMGDIFDHVISSAAFFDLAIFQNPSGKDFRSLKG